MRRVEKGRGGGGMERGGIMSLIHIHNCAGVASRREYVY